MKKIKILVCDDYEVLRKGLVQLLHIQPEFEVVGEAGDGLEVISLTRKLNPDVILMDIQMPEKNGIEASKQIRTFNSNVRIIMLTISDEEHDLFNAIKNGANGYLLKNLNMEELFSYIKSAYEGYPPFTKGLADKILQEFSIISTKVEASSEINNLSDREKEILELVSKGYTNKDIGNFLYISPHTVKKHLQNVLAKLHVTNRAQAVAKAAQAGILKDI
ncbi:response regulator [Cytobacillus sp. Hm23]